MSYSHNRLYVIIPAAGSGSRMHSDKNKLFMEVDGISVIDRTMAAFRRFADEYGVDIEAILVISPDAASTWEEYIKGKELPMGKVMNAIRLALAGSASGLGIADIVARIGKKETAARLESAVSKLGN